MLNRSRYDPETNQYIFSETIGRMNYRPPVSMSLKEYLEYDTKTSISDFWLQKARESVAPKTSPLLANFQLGKRLTRFRTDAISIVPQGSADWSSDTIYPIRKIPHCLNETAATDPLFSRKRSRWMLPGRLVIKCRLASLQYRSNFWFWK